MSMKSSPIKTKWGRYGKMKQNYDYEFLNPYDDFENLSKFIQPFVPWELLDDSVEEHSNPYENELKEYVIFKAVAIMEQSYRNLLIFLIDDLKLDVHESLGIGNKITISINDLNKISKNNVTKGFLITESLSSQINRPFLINQTFSKILKLNFHDTLSNLYTIYNNENNSSFPMNHLGGLKTLSEIFENENNDSEPYEKEFLRIFELRNHIAHNVKHTSFYEGESILENEEMDLHKWLASLLAYVSFGIKLIAFYGIFCSKFNNLESLSKMEIFAST